MTTEDASSQEIDSAYKIGGPSGNGLVICAIIKNEGKFIYEWLSFHSYIGVRHFYLYDNGSTDATKEIVRLWPDQSKISLIDWPEQGGQQIAVYRHMLECHQDSEDWCAFIDCDEFLTPQSGRTLNSVLQYFSSRSNGIYVHWLMFGSSGQVDPTDGLVTERFTRRAYNTFPPNNIGKSVVKLNKARGVNGCHIIQCDGPMINDAGDEIDQDGSGIHSRSSHKLIALNHYFTKSLSEWRIRRAIGRATKSTKDHDFRREEEEFHRHDQNVVEDLTAFCISMNMKQRYYELSEK